MYSSQKISLNSAIVKPRLINLPCGEERYFCSSACQAASDSGGSQPVTGRHSTIESPELGESRERTDDDHKKNHRSNDDQPVAHGCRDGLHVGGTMREPARRVIRH